MPEIIINVQLLRAALYDGNKDFKMKENTLSWITASGEEYLSLSSTCHCKYLRSSIPTFLVAKYYMSLGKETEHLKFFCFEILSILIDLDKQKL